MLVQSDCETACVQWPAWYPIYPDRKLCNKVFTTTQEKECFHSVKSPAIFDKPTPVPAGHPYCPNISLQPPNPPRCPERS